MVVFVVPVRFSKKCRINQSDVLIKLSENCMLLTIGLITARKNSFEEMPITILLS